MSRQVGLQDANWCGSVTQRQKGKCINQICSKLCGCNILSLKGITASKPKKGKETKKKGECALTCAKYCQNVQALQTSCLGPLHWKFLGQIHRPWTFSHKRYTRIHLFVRQKFMVVIVNALNVSLHTNRDTCPFCCGCTHRSDSPTSLRYKFVLT